MRLHVVGLGSALLMGLTIVLGGSSCRTHYDANEPVKMAPEGCCKLADKDMTKFAGCRMVHRCRDDEPIWIRGAVNCSPVDEARCAGGRCCELQPLYGSPDAVLNWDETMKESGAKPGTKPSEPAAPTTPPQPPASDDTPPPPGDDAPAPE